MPIAQDPSSRRIRRTFFYLLVLFMVPLILASWMAIKHQWLPLHTTNHGQLLQPPFDIAQLNLSTTGHWLLLYVNAGKCDQHCEKALYNIRQIRTATGKDADRVERGVLTFSDKPFDANLRKLLNTDFKGTLSFTTSRERFKQFLQGNDLLDGIYIVDPLGNVMMFYSLDSEPMGIFKDLTRLLKLSHIG